MVRTAQLSCSSAVCDDGPVTKRSAALTVRVRAAVSVIVVALVALPAVTGRDSFPLSTYPMYADDRPAVATFNTAIDVQSNGGWDRLTISQIANTDDPLIAQSLLAHELRRDNGRTLCTEILNRMGTADGGIELVADRVDVRSGELLDRTVHRRCGIE